MDNCVECMYGKSRKIVSCGKRLMARTYTYRYFDDKTTHMKRVASERCIFVKSLVIVAVGSIVPAVVMCDI